MKWEKGKTSPNITNPSSSGQNTMSDNHHKSSAPLLLHINAHLDETKNIMVSQRREQTDLTTITHFFLVKHPK
jgi:hypothetical protein